MPPLTSLPKWTRTWTSYPCSLYLFSVVYFSSKYHHILMVHYLLFFSGLPNISQPYHISRGNFLVLFMISFPVHRSTLYKVSEQVSEVAQLCPTLCDPVDCSLPGSSIHGILQTRILEWVAISFSRGSSRSRDQSRVSRIGSRRFNLWVTREDTIEPVIEHDFMARSHLTGVKENDKTLNLYILTHTCHFHQIY